MSNPAQLAQDLAGIVAAYYMELVRCGVSAEAAVELAMGFQDLLFQTRFDTGEKDGD